LNLHISIPLSPLLNSICENCEKLTEHRITNLPDFHSYSFQIQTVPRIMTPPPVEIEISKEKKGRKGKGMLWTFLFILHFEWFLHSFFIFCADFVLLKKKVCLFIFFFFSFYHATDLKFRQKYRREDKKSKITTITSPLDLLVF
jgi:hypothetical protein